MRALVALSICFVLGSAHAVTAQVRTYGGFECTDDCSGHAAGYKWAEKRGITDESDCPLPNNSPSFQEGCIAYTQDSARPNPDQDDDDNLVGPLPNNSDDDDK